MKYVIYFRVSTKKQGQSGLGLAAQRTIVENYIKNNSVIGEFTEVETGKSINRPQLNKALECCKSNNATLVVAKLDRLARNLHFVTCLQAANIDFVCCDMPTANRLTIHIIAAIAENEAQLISTRTKQALDALKQRGKKLGSPQNLTTRSREISLQVRSQNALMDESNRKAGALIVSLRREGYSFYKIAQTINDLGFTTRRGGKFQTNQVQILHKRYEHS